MTLSVEDGTGLSNAESYESVTNALSYAASLGRTEFTSLQLAQQEIRLRLATQYLDTMFVVPGGPLLDTQALVFPRLRLYANGSLVSGVPAGVRRACCELASYPGLPALLPADTINALKSRSVEMAGLKKSEVYRDEITYPHYYVAERLMMPYSGGSVRGGLVVGRLNPF